MLHQNPIESGDKAQAVLLAHTLKGVALQVGAVELSEAAARLQQELEHGEELASSLLPLLEVEEKLAVALESIASVHLP